MKCKRLGEFKKVIHVIVCGLLRHKFLAMTVIASFVRSVAIQKENFYEKLQLKYLKETRKNYV
ncbi:MAG: hypothetical protein P8Y43_00845 [Sulfurovaceae bacterium]